MILSKRERYIGIVAGSVLALLAIDFYVLSPLLARRTELRDRINLARHDLERAERLVSNRGRVDDRWSDMVFNGLKADASAAEGQVLQAVHDWARESGLNLPGLKRERTEKVKQFQQITFRTTANGTMAGVSRFLWKIQTARIPVRVTDIQIISRKGESTDDLTVTMGISTVFLPPEEKKPAKPGEVAAAGPSSVREVYR